MTEQQHPITPPPELMEQWRDRWIDDAAEDNTQDLSIRPSFMVHIATQAARWGADQELEACCEWLVNHFHGMKEWSEELRSARRPKPPSLAEQALAKTEAILNDPSRVLLTEVREALELNRRTLKRLQELENNDN